MSPITCVDVRSLICSHVMALALTLEAGAWRCMRNRHRVKSDGWGSVIAHECEMMRLTAARRWRVVEVVGRIGQAASAEGAGSSACASWRSTPYMTAERMRPNVGARKVDDRRRAAARIPLRSTLEPTRLHAERNPRAASMTVSRDELAARCDLPTRC